MLIALLLAASGVPPVSLPDTRVEHLASTKTGLSYRLHVSVPPDFAQREVRYPLVLLLDADYSFPIAYAVASHLRERSDLPDLIVVAIGYDGEPAYRRNRTRDYTPTHVPDGGYGPEFQRFSGGAPAFLGFIEHEVLPWLAGRYRTEPKPILVGHSYGGLFALWTALTRPELLAGVIAVSPSLWYDDHLLDRLERKSAARPIRVYAGVGDEENPTMASDLKAFGQTFQERRKGVQAKFEVLSGETHNSVFPRALSNGLRFFWPRGTFPPSKAPGTRPVGG